MAFQIGGLATGFDTNGLIEELLKVERRPIERLTTEKNYLTSRVSAFSSFHNRLRELSARVENLDTLKEIRAYKVSSPTNEFFSGSASETAVAGQYQIEVKSLAWLQKDVSSSFASKTEEAFGTGSIQFTVGTQETTIGYENESLTGIMDKINAANTGESATGISAAIINDGVSGYRLVLTGKDSATEFSVQVVETEAGEYTGLGFANTQLARQAAIIVDGIQISSKNNTFEDAIPGVTLHLNKAHLPGQTTALTVGTDEEALKGKLDGFISAYNEVVNFFSKQADAAWGRDPALRSTIRRLQDLLVSPSENSGNLKTLSQLGIRTEKDGTLKLDASKLPEIMRTDLAGLEKLLVGEVDAEGAAVAGIADKFKSLLTGLTNPVDGLLASRKSTTDISLRQIDKNIGRMESRLEQRETTLRAQFVALEQLVSTMNAQSSYLSQQMNMISNLWSQKK